MQRRFFTKNRKCFRYPECNCHLKHETPPPWNMWFYGLWKLRNWLKIYKYNQVHYLLICLPPLLCFLKVFPSQILYCIINKLLIIHFLKLLSACKVHSSILHINKIVSLYLKMVCLIFDSTPLLSLIKLPCLFILYNLEAG